MEKKKQLLESIGLNPLEVDRVLVIDGSVVEETKTTTTTDDIEVKQWLQSPLTRFWSILEKYLLEKEDKLLSCIREEEKDEIPIGVLVKEFGFTEESARLIIDKSEGRMGWMMRMCAVDALLRAIEIAYPALERKGIIQFDDTVASAVDVSSPPATTTATTTTTTVTASSSSSSPSFTPFVPVPGFRFSKDQISNAQLRDLSSASSGSPSFTPFVPVPGFRFSKDQISNVQLRDLCR